MTSILKSTLRQPLRTLALLAFIAVLSFAFVSRAAEYVIVNTEAERLGGYYRSIGSVEVIDWEKYDEDRVKTLLSENPYIALEDERRMCSAEMEGVYNADLDGCSSDYWGAVYPLGIHTSDVYLYGTLMEGPVAVNQVTSLIGGFNGSMYRYRFAVDAVEAGYPEYVGAGDSATLYFLLDEGEDGSALSGFQIGERYFIKAYYSPWTIQDKESSNRAWLRAKQQLIMKPLDGLDAWFLPMAAGESVDFSAPKYAELKNAIELADINQHAMSVYRTKDMSAIPEMQEASRTHYLTEGRWLNREDDLEQRCVCVVRDEFAQTRGLTIGDTLNLTFRDTDSSAFYSGSIKDEEKDRWREFETHSAEFEIVGLFSDLRDFHTTMDFSQIYVPDSCVPEGYGSVYNPAGHSIVLDSTEHESVFMAETRAAFDALGVRIEFVEHNAENFWASVRPVRQSTAMSAGIFGAVLLVGLMLAAFVYLRQRRREFAVCRALGVPSGKAARGLLLPGALLGFVGVALGGGLSWQYALNKAAETLSTVEAEGGKVAVSLPAEWLLGLIGAALAVYALFLLAGLLTLTHRPVLELLQGVAVKAKRARPTPAREGAAPAPTKLATGGSAPAKTVEWQPVAPRGTGRGFAAAMRFPLRYAVRSWGRSLLCGALALAVLLAMGAMRDAMARSEAEIDRLYATTIVEGEIIQADSSLSVSSSVAGAIIRQRTVDALLQSGMIREIYLEAAMKLQNVGPVDIRHPTYEDLVNDERFILEVPLYGISDLDTFLEGQEIELSFFGSSGNIFEREWSTERAFPVIVPASAAAQFGVPYGSKLQVSVSVEGGGSATVSVVMAGSYSEKQTMGEAKGAFLVPLSTLASLAEEKETEEFCYSVVRFTIDPSRNRELGAFEEEAKRIVSNSSAGLQGLRLLLWDEELKEAIAPMEENIRLLSILYPVALALVALIGAGLSLLLVFQSAREAAALRALGVPKGRIRAMFTAQQGLLCLPGLLLGFLGLLLLQGDAAKVFSVDSLLCAGLYLLGTLLGAYFGAMAVTRRKPMELLQVKE